AGAVAARAPVPGAPDGRCAECLQGSVTWWWGGLRAGAVGAAPVCNRMQNAAFAGQSGPFSCGCAQAFGYYPAFGGTQPLAPFSPPNQSLSTRRRACSWARTPAARASDPQDPST